MIPLSDSRRSRGFAWGTWALVAANLLAFFWELRLGAELEGMISRLALSPAEALGPGPLLEIALRLPRLVAALFLHGGWLHLLGNMAFLAVFGDDVEGQAPPAPLPPPLPRLRPRRGAAQIAVTPRSPLPLIGASGAIAGVLGAFLVLFPKARLAGVLPLGCLVIPLKSRAFLFIPFWFLLQLYGALSAAPGSQTGGVAWYAHLAGFAAGPILLYLLRRR